MANRSYHACPSLLDISFSTGAKSGLSFYVEFWCCWHFGGLLDVWKSHEPFILSLETLKEHGTRREWTCLCLDKAPFPKRFLLGLRISAFGVHSAASNPHMAVFSTLLFQSASPICSRFLRLSCLGRSSMQEDGQLLPSSQSFWLFPCLPDPVLPCLQILSDIWWRQQKQDSHEPQLSSQRWFVSLSICTCVVMRDLSGRASRSSPTSVG